MRSLTNKHPPWTKRGATMSSVGAERVSWRGVGNFILIVVRSSWFFQTMITIQYTSRHFKKIPTFSTFKSPIDVDNRNLVVPYKRVRHPSQLHILYMFYTYFFTRNPLRWVPDMSGPSRTPSSTSTTTTSSTSTISYDLFIPFLSFLSRIQICIFLRIRIGQKHANPCGCGSETLHLTLN